MSEYTTNWNKKELEAYLLFYCANADFVETEEEKKLIHDKVSDEVYTKMHLEFIKDNDYQRIQKIIDTSERLGLTKAEIDEFFNEMLEIFNADGKYDILERELYIGLKRILK